MSEGHDDKNAFLYFLAGVGLGALIGAAAGLLMAPKSGAETRQDLAHKFEEFKHKVQDYMRERKAKKSSAGIQSPDEAGA